MASKRSLRIWGRCLKTLTLRYLYKKKSQRLKSGVWGGHETSYCNEIRRSWNIFCKMAGKLQATWTVDLTCWNQKASESYSFIFGRKTFPYILKYRLKVPMCKEQRHVSGQNAMESALSMVWLWQYFEVFLQLATSSWSFGHCSPWCP